MYKIPVYSSLANFQLHPTLKKNIEIMKMIKSNINNIYIYMVIVHNIYLTFAETGLCECFVLLFSVCMQFTPCF